MIKQVFNKEMRWNCILFDWTVYDIIRQVDPLWFVAIGLEHCEADPDVVWRGVTNIFG